jgi:16S rRNA (guanine527-N7)-methyltransferase
MYEYLKSGLELLNLKVDFSKIERLMQFVSILREYNSHTNLTAIREEKKIVEKHVLDSLLLQKYIRKNHKRAIDIGTGAGFPGMLLAIWNPEMQVTLLDSVQKKTKFLEKVRAELSVWNTEIATARAEDFVKRNREMFDLGFCRGVSQLAVILEYMLPFLKIGGLFLPQKSGDTEVSTVQNALKELNGKIKNIHRLKLPFSYDDRVILEIEKLGFCPRQYPRKPGILQKKPL